MEIVQGAEKHVVLVKMDRIHVQVEELVEVRLADFMDDANVFTENLTTSYATDVPVPAFKLNGYTVWGATGMMLSEIKTLLQQVL